MKIKTFILTFLLMMMSSPIVFGQSRAVGDIHVTTYAQLKSEIDGAAVEAQSIESSIAEIDAQIAEIDALLTGELPQEQIDVLNSAKAELEEERDNLASQLPVAKSIALSKYSLSVTEPLKIAKDVKITLDLNALNLEATGNVFQVEAGGELYLRDLSGAGTDQPSVLKSGAIAIVNKGKLTIDNTIIEGAGSSVINNWIGAETNVLAGSQIIGTKAVFANRGTLNITGEDGKRVVLRSEDRSFNMYANSTLNMSYTDVHAEYCTYIKTGEATPADETNVTLTIADNVKFANTRIGNVYFLSLADALEAAKEGETISLLKVEGYPVIMSGDLIGKNVTISTVNKKGAEILVGVKWINPGIFVGRSHDDNDNANTLATLTFDRAKIQSLNFEEVVNVGLNISGSKKNAPNVGNGKVVVKDSDVQINYINNRNQLEIINSKVTLSNGLAVGGRIAAESALEEEQTATLTLSNNSTLKLEHYLVQEDGTQAAGEVAGNVGYEGKGIIDIDATSSLLVNVDKFTVSPKGTINVNGGTFKVGVGSTSSTAPKLLNGGNVNISGTPTLAIVPADYNSRNGFYNITNATLNNVILKGSKAKLVFEGVNTINGSDFAGSLNTINEDAVLNLEGNVIGGATITNNGTIFMPVEPVTTLTTAQEDLSIETEPHNKVVYKYGKYVVEEKNYVVYIGENGYESLEDAFKDVNDNDIIEIKGAATSNALYSTSNPEHKAKIFTIKGNVDNGTTLLRIQGEDVKVTIQDFNKNNASNLIVANNAEVTLLGSNNLKEVIDNEKSGKLVLDKADVTILKLNADLAVKNKTTIRVNEIVSGRVPSISLNNATLAEGSSLPATIDVVVTGENNIINQALTVNSFTVAEGAQVTVNKKVIACTDKDNATAKVEINGKLIVDNGAEFIQDKNKPLNFNGAEITVQQGSNLRVVKPEFSGDVTLNVAGTATFSKNYNPVINEGATVTLTMNPIPQEDGTFKSPKLTTNELANLTTSTDGGYKIIYKEDDKAYVVVLNYTEGIEFVQLRKAGGSVVGYTTLQEAIDDSEGGDEIVLLPKTIKVDKPMLDEEGNPVLDINGNPTYEQVDQLIASVDMYDSYVYGKDVTITTDGKPVMVNWADTLNTEAEYLFVGRGGTGEDGNATLTFDNAIIKSATKKTYSNYAGLNISGAQRVDGGATPTKYDGSVKVNANSNIEVDYIYVRHEMVVEGTVTVPQGIVVAGRPASESTVLNEETSDYMNATATVVVKEGATLNVTTGHPQTGLGFLEGSDEQGLGVMNVYGTFLNDGDFIVRETGTMRVEGAVVKIGDAGTEKRLLNNGNIYIKGESTFNAVAKNGTNKPIIVSGAELDNNTRWIGTYSTVTFEGENTVVGSDFQGGTINVAENAILNLNGNVLGGKAVNVAESATIYMPNVPETTFTTSVANLEDVITTDDGYKVYYNSGKYIVLSAGLSAYDYVYNETTKKGYRTLAEALAEVGPGEILDIQKPSETGEASITYPATDTYTKNFTIKGGEGYKLGHIFFKKDVNVTLENATLATSLYAQDDAIITFVGTNKVNSVIGTKDEKIHFNVNDGSFLDMTYGTLIANVNMYDNSNISFKNVGDATYGNNIYMYGVELSDKTAINGANVVFVEGENTVNGATIKAPSFVVNEDATVDVDNSLINDYDAGDRYMIINGDIDFHNSQVEYRYITLYNDNLTVSADADTQFNTNEIYVRSTLNIYNDVNVKIDGAQVKVNGQTNLHNGVKPSLKLVNATTTVDEEEVEVAKSAKLIINEIAYNDNSNEGYKIVYEGGAYIVVPTIYNGVDAVAINGYGYPTLKEALEVAKDEDVLYLQKAYTANGGIIDMQGVVLGKDVTITGDDPNFTYKADWRTGKLYIAYEPHKTPLEGDQTASVKFQDVKIEDHSNQNGATNGIIVSCAHKDKYAFNGTLQFVNSNVGVHYIADRYLVELDNSEVTVTRGFIVGHRPEAEYVQDGKAQLILNNGSEFTTLGSHPDALGYEYKGEISINNSSFISKADLEITGNGTLNINDGGNFTVENNGKLTNNGTVNVSGTATVATATETLGTGIFNMKDVNLGIDTKINAPSNNFVFKAGSNNGETYANIVDASTIQGNKLTVNASVQFKGHKSEYYPYPTLYSDIDFVDVINNSDVLVDQYSVITVSNKFTNNNNKAVLTNNESVVLTELVNNGIVNVGAKITAGIVNNGTVNTSSAGVTIEGNITNNGIVNVTRNTTVDGDITNNSNFNVSANLTAYKITNSRISYYSYAEFNQTGGLVKLGDTGTSVFENVYSSSKVNVSDNSNIQAELKGTFNMDGVTMNNTTTITDTDNNATIVFDGTNDVSSSLITVNTIDNKGETILGKGSINTLNNKEDKTLSFGNENLIVTTLTNDGKVTVNKNVEVTTFINDNTVEFTTAESNKVADLENNGTVNVYINTEIPTITNNSGAINIKSATTLASSSLTNNAKIYFEGIDPTTTLYVARIDVPAQRPILADDIDETTYEVYYSNANGGYKVRAIRYVAKIVNDRYRSLDEAVQAANNGDIITLLHVDNYPVDMNTDVVGKNITITTNGEQVKVDWSKGYLFVGRHDNGSEPYSNGDATLTFYYANLVSKSFDKSHDKGLNISGKASDGHAYNGTVNVENSTIEVDYIYVRNKMNIDNSKVVVKGDNGYTASPGSICNVLISGRPQTETGTGDHALATLTLKNNSTLEVANNIRTNLEGKGKMVVEANSTVKAESVYVPAQSWLESTGNIFASIGEEIPNCIVLDGGVYTNDVNAFCATGYKAYPCEYTGDYSNQFTDFWAVRESKGSQTIKLVGKTSEGTGWNYVSSYMENFDLTDLQNGIVEGGVTTAQIWSQLDGIRSLTANEWTGSLSSVSPSQMYKIYVDNDTDVTLQEGDYVDYGVYQMYLEQGWNWIGYPVTKPMMVSDAFKVKVLEVNPVTNDTITFPAEGDMIISNNSMFAMFENGKWENDIEPLVPGGGYMYYNTGGHVEFTYPNEVTTSTTTPQRETKFWNAPVGFENIMTMVAMVNIDGEFVDGNYEVAAFANGELRGSARPIYVESRNAYYLMMSIGGSKVEELTFKYYDVNYGTEYELDNRINFTSNAIVGSFDEPYVLTMNITDIEEVALSDVNIYPNPTTTGVKVNLDATCEKVEIFNALGVKVAEYQNVDSIDAFETAGIYVIRLTNGGEIKHTRLVVK